jgi:hypothetical protein
MKHFTVILVMIYYVFISWTDKKWTALVSELRIIIDAFVLVTLG